MLNTPTTNNLNDKILTKTTTTEQYFLTRILYYGRHPSLNEGRTFPCARWDL